MPIPPAASKLITTASDAAPVPGRESAAGARAAHRARPRPASSHQDQPAEEQVALEGIQPPEDDHQCPAGSRRGDQPAQPRGGCVRFVVSVTRVRTTAGAGCRLAVATRPAPRRPGRRSRRLARDATEQVPESPRPVRPPGQARPRAARRPDLEKQVVRIEDLLARLRQLVLEIGRREVARPDPPPEGRRAQGTASRSAAPPVITPHAPCQYSQR